MKTAELKLKSIPVPIFVAAIFMLVGLAFSQVLKPTKILADELPLIVLVDLIPAHFGDWREDKSVPPVVDDPTVQAVMATAYSDSMNRTYRNSRGQLVQLTLAYGRNQNSWSTAAHRPEFCYASQGFTVEPLGVLSMAIHGHKVGAARFIAKMGSQQEHVSYWVTLANTATTPGFKRKIQQLRYGLQGLIVDGFLVRVSSMGSPQNSADILHEQFLNDLELVIPLKFKDRLFGTE